MRASSPGAAPGSSGATPRDLQYDAAVRDADSGRRREKEEAERYAAEEEARQAAEAAAAAAAAAAEEEASQAAAAAAAAEAEAKASWIMSPRALLWLKKEKLSGVKPQKLTVATSHAAPAPAPGAQGKRPTPPARKRNTSVPTPLRAQLPDMGDATSRTYGDHRLKGQQRPAGTGAGSASSAAAAARPSFIRRYLHFLTYGLSALLLALATLLALEKGGLFTPNHSILGAAVCPASSLEGGCQWSWKSGGDQAGSAPALNIIRALLLHTAMGAEYALNKLPSLASPYLLVPSDFVARCSGFLEGAYFVGILLAIVRE